MSLNTAVANMSRMMEEMGLSELTVVQSFLFGIWKKEINLTKKPEVAQNPIFAAPAATPLAKKSAKAAAAAEAEEVAEPTPEKNSIKSPMVGIVYLSPEPGAKAFTQIGGKVKSGETLALIEAMKTFNPVKADRDGVVKEILVKDGQAVEFDTPLIVIE